MRKTNTAPLWGQWAAGATLLAIALTTGGVGLLINVTHGMERGPAAAILFGLADAARIALPFAAVLLGWSRQVKLTAAICTAISLYCAASAMIAGHDARHARQTGQAEAYAANRDDAGRIRAELAGIRESGNPVTLRQQAAQAGERAAAEEKSGKGGRYQAALAEQAELTRRADLADRRAALEARLDALGAAGKTLAPAAIEASGRGWIDALAAILLVETLVWLSIPGLSLLAASRKPKPRPRAAKPKTEAKPKRKAKATPKPRAVSRRKPAEAPPATFH